MLSFAVTIAAFLAVIAVVAIVVVVGFVLAVGVGFQALCEDDGPESDQS